MLQLLSRLPSSRRPSLTNLVFSVSSKTEHFISKCSKLCKFTDMLNIHSNIKHEFDIKRTVHRDIFL
jgi:hypothetical protein